MPWPEHHKAQTRDRIVQAAAAAFRAGGVANVRVEDVMARAGLTHGGFYAHFRSKEDLLRAAVEHAGRQTVEMLSKATPESASEEPFQAAIDAYLSSAHAAHPEVGCPLATLGPEIARAAGATHRALAEGVRDRLAWMRQLLPERQRDAVPDDQIIGTLACMVGGIILARAVGGKDSAEILRACREFVRQRAGESPARVRRRQCGSGQAAAAPAPAKRRATRRR